MPRARAQAMTGIWRCGQHNLQTRDPHMSDRDGLTSLLSDRKISTRIGLGFAFVLAVLAVVSGTAWYAFRSSAEGFATYAQRVAVVSVASDVDRSFVNLRRF